MSQGIGGYLMEAAQTFGDNLIGIFDRIGQLAGGVISNGTSAIGGGIAAATVATTTAASNAVSGVSAPAAPDLSGAAQTAVSNVITLPSSAVSNLNAVRDNPVMLSWAAADRGDVLGNLARPDTPYVPMPELGVGMAMG